MSSHICNEPNTSASRPDWLGPCKEEYSKFILGIAIVSATLGFWRVSNYFRSRRRFQEDRSRRQSEKSVNRKRLIETLKSTATAPLPDLAEIDAELNESYDEYLSEADDQIEQASQDDAESMRVQPAAGMVFHCTAEGMCIIRSRPAEKVVDYPLNATLYMCAELAASISAVVRGIVCICALSNLSEHQFHVFLRSFCWLDDATLIIPTCYLTSILVSTVAQRVACFPRLTSSQGLYTTHVVILVWGVILSGVLDSIFVEKYVDHAWGYQSGQCFVRSQQDGPWIAHEWWRLTWFLTVSVAIVAFGITMRWLYVHGTARNVRTVLCPIVPPFLVVLLVCLLTLTGEQNFNEQMADFDARDVSFVQSCILTGSATVLFLTGGISRLIQHCAKSSSRYWGNDLQITVRNPEDTDDLKVLCGHRPRTCEELQARHGVRARHEKDIVGKWFGALQERLFGVSSNPVVQEAGQPLGKEVPSASCCRRFVLGLKATIGLGQQELVDSLFHGKIVTFSTEEDGAADKLKAASYNAKDYERDQSDKAKVRFHEADSMCRELVAKELKTKHLSNLKQAGIELDSMLDTLHNGLMDQDRPTFCNIEAFVTALNDPVYLYDKCVQAIEEKKERRRAFLEKRRLQDIKDQESKTLGQPPAISPCGDQTVCDITGEMPLGAKQETSIEMLPPTMGENNTELQLEVEDEPIPIV